MSKQRVAMCPQPFDLDKEEAAARVCYVQSGEAKGSGLLVEWKGRPCIITNNHVLEHEEHAKNATVLFNYRLPKTQRLSAALSMTLMAYSSAVRSHSP
mmetsp:Transcript_11853/g.28754  ORF Transcript_11853/g.28754 Transcript_11853/m.28754 type:complete len:98 (-) Transcript_11853:955-1248(-)